MSTSVVMMDTGATHRRTANNATGSTTSIFGDLKSATGNLHHHHHHSIHHHHHNTNNTTNNLPFNLTMKLFNTANSNNGNNSSASTHLLSSTTNSSNRAHQYHPKNLSTGNVSPAATTPTSTPQVQVKLEPRVPSPCTADLALIANGKGLKTSVPSSSAKDLSIYLTTPITTNSLAAKTGTTNSPLITQQLFENLAINCISKPNNKKIVDSNESLDLFSSSSSSSSISSTNSLSGLTANCKIVGSTSPPLLIKNHSQSPTATQQFLSTSPGTPNSTIAMNGMIGGIKRHHDEAFGVDQCSSTPSPPMITMNGGHPLLPQTTTPTNGCSNTSMTGSPTSSYSDFGSTCKEEMSPSNSVNGYTSVDSLGDPKKKKGPVPRQQEELCLVCGDRASGYHYNALTCEGCKGFFRRSITKNAVYQCKYGNNCEIDMYMRRKCQECRLKKCLSVGMRPECVVPEYQCAIKREAKRANKDKDKPNSTTKEGLSPNTQVIIEEKQPLTPLMTNNWNGSSNGDMEIGKLTEEQNNMIKKLVFCQDEFESPTPEDVKKIAPFPIGHSEEDNQKRLQHVTEMTILTVQLIVEFSKRVPYFDTLFRDDQITLLKACSSEVMMLRCSRKYDIKTDSIVYANNQPYTRQNYSSACIAYVADTLFNFCRRMHMLKVDNAEYALLTAIVIFSDRPYLLESKKVEEIQEKYIEMLRVYVENRRLPNKCHFAKLLGILTELRTLGNINSEMCVSLKVQNKKLPPFLAEIWDIQD